MQYPAAGTDLQVLLTTASTGTTWPTCADSRLSTTISGSISIVTTDGTIAGTNPTECWECVFFNWSESGFHSIIDLTNSNHPQHSHYLVWVSVRM